MRIGIKQSAIKLLPQCCMHKTRHAPHKACPQQAVVHNLGGQTKCQLRENIIMQNGLEPSCVWPAHAAAAYWGQEAVGGPWRATCSRHGVQSGMHQKGLQKAPEGTAKCCSVPARHQGKELLAGLQHPAVQTAVHGADQKLHTHTAEEQPFPRRRQHNSTRQTNKRTNEQTDRQTNNQAGQDSHPPTHPPTCLN